MTTTTLEIELPSSTTSDEAKLLLTVKLYEVGKITLGQAAKIAGYSKRAFLEVLDHQKYLFLIILQKIYVRKWVCERTYCTR